MKLFIATLLMITGSFTVANALDNIQPNSDSITLNVTNPLPVHALTNLSYTATYTLTSQTTPINDIKLVLPAFTPNPWSYTNSCDQVPQTTCVINITLADPSIHKIMQFQPQISVQGNLIKDTNPPYDITVDDQVDSEVDIVNPFSPKTLYPGNISHGIYNVTNLQKPNIRFDKVEIDPQSLPEGMTVDTITTTCQQSLDYLEGCQMGFIYAPTKQSNVHFKPAFLAYMGSHAWHIQSPDSVAQDLSAMYWVKADQNKGKLIEMVEDPERHTLYGETEMFMDTHNHYVQNLLTSNDHGVTWFYDANADLSKLSCAPNCNYAEHLQIMKWQSNQPEPIGFLLNSPGAGGSMFNLYVNVPAPQYLATPLNVYKSFSYSANNDDYQILLHPSTLPFVGMAIHSRVSNTMATVADFTQPPFSNYPMTETFHTPGANSVAVVTSTVTHKIYLQLIDDNKYGQVFSADMSNPMQITQASWQHIASVPLHFSVGISDRTPAYFGIATDPAKGIDHLYSAGIRALQPGARTSVYAFIPGQEPEYLSAFGGATAIRVVPTGGIYAALANQLVFSPDDGQTINTISVPDAVVFPITHLYLLDNNRLSFVDSEVTSKYSNFGSMYVDTNPNE